MYSPSTASKEILGEIFLGWNLIFWDSAEEICLQARWGRVKALQFNPAGRLRSSQQGLMILYQEVRLSAGERGLFWVDWKCCHIVCAQQQKGNIRASCYITLTPPAVSVRLLSFSNSIPQESSTPFLFWDMSKKQPEQTEIICCMNTLLAAKAGWISPWLSAVRTCHTELPVIWRKSEYNILLQELKELGECVWVWCVCGIILYKALRNYYLTRVSS